MAEIAKEQQESWEAMPLEAHMAHYESQGIDRKEAMAPMVCDGLKRHTYGFITEADI